MLRDESLFQFFTAAGKDNEERKGNVIRDIAVWAANQFSR